MKQKLCTVKISNFGRIICGDNWVSNSVLKHEAMHLRNLPRSLLYSMNAARVLTFCQQKPVSALKIALLRVAVNKPVALT